MPRQWLFSTPVQTLYHLDRLPIKYKCVFHMKINQYMTAISSILPMLLFSKTYFRQSVNSSTGQTQKSRHLFQMDDDVLISFLPCSSCNECSPPSHCHPVIHSFFLPIAFADETCLTTWSSSRTSKNNSCPTPCASSSARSTRRTSAAVISISWWTSSPSDSWDVIPNSDWTKVSPAPIHHGNSEAPFLWVLNPLT